MTRMLHVGAFDLTYTESLVESPILWERHCHPRYEMISVLEGDISIMPEGQTYRLTAGHTVLIPPLLYHTITANQQGAYRRVTALFDLAAVPAVLRENFSERADTPIAFSSPHAEDLQALLEEENADLYAPLATSLMTQIFYRALRTERITAEEEPDEFLRLVTTYVDRHLDEKILLDHLAAHTARSKSSVCHLFEEKMGITPKQYVLQKKMALADRLIRDGVPPTLAAMRVGYDNYSAFWRMYRKHYRISPTDR